MDRVCELTDDSFAVVLGSVRGARREVDDAHRRYLPVALPAGERHDYELSENPEFTAISSSPLLHDRSDEWVLRVHVGILSDGPRFGVLSDGPQFAVLYIREHARPNHSTTIAMRPHGESLTDALDNANLLMAETAPAIALAQFTPRRFDEDFRALTGGRR